jgi:hypothetical protein
MLFSIFFVMENNIILMNAPIDSEKITLCNPNGVQGGSYMTKIKYENNFGLYIQTPKLSTKQGIIATDKKNYFDIMIDSSNTELLTWVEALEECLQQKIYEKRNTWFETELDMEDIQNTMTPLLRPFRGGKYHLLRVSIPALKNMIGQNKCAIYDENENTITAKDVSPDKKIICILELQSIKFSSKYFQVDINARQVMVFNDVSLFKSCMIKLPESKAVANIDQPIIVSEPDNSDESDKAYEPDKIVKSINESIIESINDDNFEPNIIIGDEDDDNIVKTVQSEENETIINNTNQFTSTLPNDSDNQVNQENKNEEISSPVQETLSELDSVSLTPNTLEEIDINFENNDDNDDVLKLKSKEFYYDIYRLALEKARKAKRQALESFLEAKKIKETYMLDEIENDSMEDEDLENSDIEEEYEELY